MRGRRGIGVLVAMAAAVTCVGCGASGGGGAAPAPDRCVDSWNGEDTALSFGRHVYDTHESHRAQVAVLRRLWNFIPYAENLPFAWPYHFDFHAGDQVVFSVEKKFGLRDRYVVDIKDPRLDRRLVVAQAVALDALQSR